MGERVIFGAFFGIVGLIVLGFVARTWEIKGRQAHNTTYTLTCVRSNGESTEVVSFERWQLHNDTWYAGDEAYQPSRDESCRRTVTFRLEGAR